jgi:integrase
VKFGHLEDWLTWLGKEKKLSANTRKKVLGAWRVFMRWIRKRGDIDSVPELPEVPVDEYTPTIITVEKQAEVIEAIPWERRGAFMAARLGVRPREIRALNVDDYDPPWLRIDKAAKGPNANAPIRGTKSRTSRRIRVDDELAEWLNWRMARVKPQDLLQGPVPLFQNPTGRRDRKRWLSNALRLEWNRACERVGIRVKMYEGCKHSTASAAVR